MKKVLVIGPSYFSYNQSIASAFDTEKFEVKVIDYSEQFGLITTYNKIVYTLSGNKNKTKEKLRRKLNRHIVETYQQYGPEIVLFIKGEVIFEETVSVMKESKNVLWVLDSIFNLPVSMKLAEKMNAVFLFEKTEVDGIRKINENTFFLPSAFDDRIFRKLTLQKDIDLLFIGTLYDSRVKLFEKLHQEFPDLKLKIFCKRFLFYKSPVKYLNSLKSEIFINRFVTPEKANILYNRSRICLNMHHGQSVYGVNPRFFEILGAGGYQLVDKKPYIEENFSDQVETYHSEEELYKKISSFFKGKKIVRDQAIYDKVRASHTYKKRVEFILERI